MATSAWRQARNEVEARVENRIRAWWFLRYDKVALRCECAREECEQTIALTLEDYELVRESPVRFAVVPSHEAPDIERVVERREDYWVVEKVGEGAAVAREEAFRTLPPLGNGRTPPRLRAS